MRIEMLEVYGLKKGKDICYLSPSHKLYSTIMHLYCK
mgnify:CR=1 FL=1